VALVQIRISCAGADKHVDPRIRWGHIDNVPPVDASFFDNRLLLIARQKLIVESEFLRPTLFHLADEKFFGQQLFPLLP
jgi:hypothetical protein